MVAHQGGWDELLIIAVPILVFGGLLMFANHRAAVAEACRVDEGGGLDDH